jgi:uncharacterized protein
MKNKLIPGLIGLALLLVLGVALAGCSSDGVSAAGNSPINVSINNQQGIIVNGEGRITVTPDIANLSVGVSAQAATVADALTQASAAMDKVIASLTASGVAKNDIKTQSFSIQQTTRYDNVTQKSVVTGYQVDNMVTAKIRAIDKTGQIIDSAATAGGDLTRINSISFAVDKPDQYYSQARQAAMTDAKNKATELAKNGGVNLGKITYITESATSPSPVPIMARDIAASGASTPISPGTTDIVLDVQITYAIE